MSHYRGLNFCLSLRIVVLLVLALTAPSLLRAQSVPNLTGSARLLGNPIQQFYTRTSDKAGAQDLQIFQDRLYIGHGSTSSSQNTKIIYYDLTKGTFDYERDASGNTLWMQSELLRNMRVQDGELILEDYDPHSRSRFYRKSADGKWTVRDVGQDAHARDMIKFGNEYFTSYGISTAPFPSVRYSPDGGQSWQNIDQRSLYNGFSLVYDRFFEFDGKLYLSGVLRGYDPSTKTIADSPQPFMLRYEGNGKFATAYARRSDFIRSSGNEFVEHANPIGRKLIFKWGSKVYLATSIEPARVTEVALPSEDVNDIIVKGTSAFVLTKRSISGGKYRSSVYRVEENGAVRGVFSFDYNGNYAASLEMQDGTFYLSVSGVNVYAVQTNETVGADTGSQPEPPATDLTVDLKVLLQGPYDSSSKSMRSVIKNYLRVEDAFASLPSQTYGGTITWEVAPEALQRDVVDFVVLELRSSTALSSKVYRRGALLMSDGSVRGFDGTSLPVVRGVPAGSYYVVVRHRNHLDVMSAAKVDFSSGKGTYDFTTSANKAYGSQSQVLLSSGQYGLYTGDMNASGRVDTPDIFTVWSLQNGLAGYRGGDADLSGFVNAFDLLRLWLPNAGRSSNVPD